jgi:hypothetical protein
MSSCENPIYEVKKQKGINKAKASLGFAYLIKTILFILVRGGKTKCL